MNIKFLPEVTENHGH